VAVGATTDTQTDWQTDASDFITCPMLCYSSRTDTNVYYRYAVVDRRCQSCQEADDNCDNAAAAVHHGTGQMSLKHNVPRQLNYWLAKLQAVQLIG